MKLTIKLKLSAMMIAIVLIVAGGIAIIQLNRASAIAKEISLKRTLNLANVRAMYWEGRLGKYLEVLHTMSDVFSSYESIPAADRRNQFTTLMQASFNENPDFVRMTTVWKPNALDGMDSKYIGTPGTTATGQVALTMTREYGDFRIQTSSTVLPRQWII